MSTRARQYAAQFETVHDDLVNTVVDCPDEKWEQPTVNDGRTIAALAHHVASVNGAFAGMVARLASGDTYTPNTSMDEIHRQNAEHAREFAGVDRQIVLDLLRTSAEAVLQQLNLLSDDRLDEQAGVFGGNPLTIAQVIEYVVVGHTAEHLGTIRTTLDQ